MTKRIRYPFFVVALALCASCLLAACGLLGGQTGQEDKSNSEVPCMDAGAPIDDHDDRAIGASPLEVVDALGGPRHAPLTWTKLQTRTQVTIELDYAGNNADVFYRPDCVRRLQLDVMLVIKTDDGRLDEHVPAKLWVTAPDSAVLDVTIPLAELHGTYDASELGGATADAPLQIEVEWADAALHGSISRTQSLGDGTGTTIAGVATW